jgi:Uma2 family endonuclease
MSTTDVRWTVADLELLPDDGRRYEVIAGELFVTRAPHWKHQNVSVKFAMALESWSIQSGLGEAAINPGLVFSEIDSVIPDVVWASHDRLATMLDEAGHLVAAPELVIEVLSPGEKNERRDREAKLKLYSDYGVLEYWIADRQQRKVEVYRRDADRAAEESDHCLLQLALTLSDEDELGSPVLPGFKIRVAQLF